MNVKKNIILDEVIKELSKKYEKKEELIKVMFQKCHGLDYDISESTKLILEYFK